MVPLDDMERVKPPFSDDKKTAANFGYDPSTFTLGIA